MALVAAGAVISLSGCGGGGDENQGDGYVSLKKFAAGAISICTVNTVSLEIAPTGKIRNENMPTIDIPPMDSGEGGVQYQADGAVRCSGYIGPRGKRSYEAEFIYQVSGEEVGCIQPMIVDGSLSSDDEEMLNALGFASASDNGNTSLGTMGRVTVKTWSDLKFHFLLDFKTSKMTIYSSATGLLVKYEDGTEGYYSGELVATCPGYNYFVEKR